MSDCSAGAQKSRVGPALPREIGENDMCARGAHRGVGNPTKSNQKGCKRSGLLLGDKRKTVFLAAVRPPQPTWW